MGSLYGYIEAKGENKVPIYWYVLLGLIFISFPFTANYYAKQENSRWIPLLFVQLAFMASFICFYESLYYKRTPRPNPASGRKIMSLLSFFLTIIGSLISAFLFYLIQMNYLDKPI